MIKLNSLIIILTSSIILILSIYLNYFHSEDQLERIYNFSLTDIEGNSFKLNKLQNKVILIVNSACECGHVSQLGSLQEVYEKYRENGFEIVLLPSDDFDQELETNKGNRLLFRL
jgi:glutathione peroxidase